MVQETLGSSTASRRFATEFVAAVNKVNYNQDSGLNAFAGALLTWAELEWQPDIQEKHDDNQA